MVSRIEHVHSVVSAGKANVGAERRASDLLRVYRNVADFNATMCGTESNAKHDTIT